MCKTSKGVLASIALKQIEKRDEEIKQLREALDEQDYTEIRDDRIRSKICQLMSEMLDNPNEQGIYSTSRFMWKMETFILAECTRLHTFKSKQLWKGTAIQNLLAIIHRDGGHHTEEVGLEQSIIDAHKVWESRQVDLEQLQELGKNCQARVEGVVASIRELADQIERRETVKH